MIRSLELRNWRSHADTQLKFGKGTNLIVGIMGSGKSAVLDGICYALYGTFPALRRRGVGTEDLIRHGEKEGRVSMEFSQGGKEYRVERKLGMGPRGVEVAAKIFEGGKLLDSGQSRVSGIVGEMLGIDYELFNRAIYSDQNNIGYFLDLDAGRRKREMDGLMGLDRFEEVRANAVRVINRLDGERKALEGRYDPKRHGEIVALLAEKKRRLSWALEDEKKASGAAEAAKKAAEDAERRLGIMGKEKGKKDNAGSALDRERGRVEALRSDVAGREVGEDDVLLRKKELADAVEKLNLANAEIAKCEGGAQALAREVGALEARLREAERALKAKKDAEADLEKALAGRNEGGMERRRGEIEKEVLELASDEKALLRGAAEIERYLGIIDEKCPVCGTELGAGKALHIKEERARGVEGKRRGAAAARKRILGLEKEKDGIRKVLGEADAARRRMVGQVEGTADISQMLEDARKKYRDAEGKAAEMRNARGAAEKRHGDAAVAARDAEAMLEKRRALISAEKRVLELEKEFSSIMFDEKEYAELGRRVRELMVEREKAVGKMREVGKEIASLGEMAAGLAGEMHGMEGLREGIMARGEELAELALFRNAVVEAQAELRADLVEAINSAMNGIWPVLYPYSDYKQLRIAAGGEDYSFEIYDGEWRKLEKVGSGGEKACLALTLRIALATVLAPGAGWLVLDEPTHNLDQGAVQALAEALESRVPELVEQAFVITHDESLMNSEFAGSYRFTRDKGAAGATVVEGL